MFNRELAEQIISQFFLKKAIVLYGPRQVGKTTLCRKVLQSFSSKKVIEVSGDDIDIQELRKPSLSLLTQLTAGYEIIFIDEAQKIKQI